MKRSVNFNGFTPAHRRIRATDLIVIVTLRALGYTDAQIRDTLRQMQVNANQAQPATTQTTEDTDAS